jgi:hypothetical protein
VRREGDSSVDARARSGFRLIGEIGSAVCDWCSFEDPELVGRLWGDEPSCPKNVHFLFGNLEVVGLVGVARGTTSVSKGLERCLRGLGRSGVGDVVRLPSSLAAAVLGRVSGDLGRCFFSFGGGLDPDTIEDKLPETEWPPGRMVVPELSLETRERGLGINCMSSENPTRVRLPGFIDGSFSEVCGLVSFVDRPSNPGNGNCVYSSFLGLQGAEPPRKIAFGSLGFSIKLKS